MTVQTQTRVRRRIDTAAEPTPVPTVRTQTAQRPGRVRRVDTGNAPAADAPVPETLRKLCTEVYAANKLQNSTKNDYEKKRKILNGELATRSQAGETVEFTFDAVVDGKKIRLETSFKEGSKTSVDIVKLRQLVGDEAFMKIVSATVAAIKEVAGQTVLDQVSKTTKTGEFTASVKTAK